MRTAATMRIEIKNEHCTGACVERRMGSEDKAVERAVARSASSTRMVKSARERPKNAAGRSASLTAATPPFEAHTIFQSPGSQSKPWESASSRG